MMKQVLGYSLVSETFSVIIIMNPLGPTELLENR